MLCFRINIDSATCVVVISFDDDYACRFVKFQNVNALTIFIESNQGDEDTTKVSKIQILGYSGEVMKVADIMKNQQQGG